ncbi:Fur family transcriptional regulator [Fusibacter sp. 3D3]|uniref:Fur family transcriptional regulator n=1 Tax=Fusibacter sp. 3D3 TaxID=1048380 RepID=UPI000852D150|nr:transcriptional repressor [Fusibacter sp. 3D3]GAU76189.1 Fe2+/Zn2+ uptake regulation proteins [Fusibacter sp. 3D3]
MYVENVGDFLKTHGIKPSYQRVKIYEFLMNTIEHPTVENIYNALNGDIPTLSKTTVYNTLKTFIEKEIAMVITIDENETRFDADTNLHGHFKCEVCHSVYDFDVKIEDVGEESLEGFEIKEK